MKDYSKLDMENVSMDYRELRGLVNKTHDRFSEINFDESLSLLQKVNLLAEHFKIVLKDFQSVVDYLDDFINKFDENLYETVDEIIKKWLDDGVFDGLLNDFLETLIKTSGYNVLNFGAKGDGITDDLEAFQKAVDTIGMNGGGRLIVPNREYVFNFKKGSTILKPTRCFIPYDNIEIVGVGSPTILMKNFTRDYMDSIDDYASSGRDIFTAFSFTGKHCSIKNINFKGEYDKEFIFRYKSPRSICISVKGGQYINIENINGYGIFGNVINVTNSYVEYDSPYRSAMYVNCDNIISEKCLENGVNYMGGGTTNCHVSNLTSIECANGLESACINFTVTNCIFIKCKSSGLALSGDNITVTNVIARYTKRWDENGMVLNNVGYGLVVTEGKNIIFSNCKFLDNNCFGVFVYPSVNDLTFIGCEVKRNAKEALYKNNLQLVGTEAKKISNMTFKACDFETESGVIGGVFTWCKDVTVTDCKGRFVTTGLIFNNNCFQSVSKNNDFNKAVAMNDTTGVSYMNGDQRYYEKTSINNGNYYVGDTIINRNKTVGGVSQWVVLQKGTIGSIPKMTATTTSGSNQIIVTSNGLKINDIIVIEGSGVKEVKNVDGLTITLDSAITTNGTGLEVNLSNPIIEVSSQNGVKKSVTSKPDFLGQMAVTGGTSPKAYISVGVNSVDDWVQIGLKN